MDPEAQGAAAPQDPQATPDPAPVATPAPDPAPAAPTGPWADQLAQFDEALRPQVDGFLREHVQPYVTRLEQERPQVDPGAIKLWEDINGENAAATYLALTGELFDPEVAEIVQGALADYYAEPGNPPDPAAVTPDPAQPQQLDPRVEELLLEREQTKYHELVDAALEKHKIPADWKEVIHPMIVSADGQIDVAAEQLRSKLLAGGIITEEPAEPTPAPPAVGDPTPVPPPVAKDYKGDLGAAIDDFLDNQAVVAPPPSTGTV